MSERLTDVVAQIENVRQLQAVVTAMRGIAASRAQKGRVLLSGIEAYAETVSRAIGQALNLLPPAAPGATPPSARRLGLILFCAEQGFAGAFSERILDAVAADLDGAVTVIVGSRGAVVADERGLEPAWTVPLATHVETIPAFANGLVDRLYAEVAGGRTTHIDVVFSRAAAGGISVDRHSLLPFDFGRFKGTPTNDVPLITLPAQALLENLAAEYVFAQICQAAMHAFEAENEARMLAMTSARSNIGEKLTELSRRERQLRQDEITTEIIELAVGTEALGRRR